MIFIHGGGWLGNDKYADIGYMKKTVSEIVRSSLHSPLSITGLQRKPFSPRKSRIAIAQFPIWLTMQINTALISSAVMGFSAGGHWPR